MFKRIKESEKYQKFKELWDNPRTHSMIVLGLWLIFLAGVIVFIRLTSSPVSTPNTVQANSLEQIDSYDFTYEQGSLQISGQATNDKMLFYLNNQKYYWHENVYLFEQGTLVKKENFDLGILKINPQMLNNLLADISYTEVSDYKQYLVPLDRFFNLYEFDTEVDLTKAMSYNMMVRVYEKNNTIYKITLDLTNYMLLKTGSNSSEFLTIYYNNINKGVNFEEYDQMIGVVS